MWNCSTEYTNTGGLPKTEEGVASIIDGGEAKDLFGVKSTSRKEIVALTNFGKLEVDAGATITAADRPSAQSTADFAQYFPFRTFITNKKIVGLGLVLLNKELGSETTFTPTEPVKISVRNFGVSILQSNQTYPNTPNEVLCNIMPTADDLGKYVIYRLDGTDSRVSNINQEYAVDGGVILPENYHIGYGSNKTENTDALVGYIRGGDRVYTGNVMFISATDKAPGATLSPLNGTLILDVYIEKEVNEPEYAFDEYAEYELPQATVWYKPAANVTIPAATIESGVGSYYFIRGSNVWNGKDITAISYFPKKGIASFDFVVGVPDTNNNNLIDNQPTSFTKVTPIFSVNTISVGNSSTSNTVPTIFRLDGTDIRVTIYDTEYYDKENKCFHWKSPMVLGSDSRSVKGFYYAGTSSSFKNNYGSLQTWNPTTGTWSLFDSLCLCFNLYESEFAPGGKSYKSTILGETESPLKGKWLSMIGDSISTFWGVSNVAPGSTDAAVYYPQPFLPDLHQTYWMKLCDRTGMRLLVNNSWSGSKLLGGNWPVLSNTNDRCKQLSKDGIDPDYILINIGTNDFNGMSQSGTTMWTWNGRGVNYPTYNATIPTTFREWYAQMLVRLRTNYPMAKIYCCTVPVWDYKKNGPDEANNIGVYLVEFNDAIREIATAFGARVVELATSGMDYWTTSMLYGDYANNPYGSTIYNLHPAEAGMERYYEIIRNAMENDDTTNVSCPRVSTLMKGTATAVTNSTASDVSWIVTDFNSLLTNLRNRWVIS